MKIRSLAVASLFVLSAAVTSAATIAENFSTNPLHNGWQVFGNPNLFRWNATGQNLEVTWDSRQPNSYFYHPLGTGVTRHDDFSVAFDLNLADIASGVEPGKTGPMQIGFEFLNFAGATNASFQRGNFGSVPNIAGFDYYPDGYYDFGVIYPSAAATVPAFVSGVNSFDYAPQHVALYNHRLPTNQTVHISLAYTASNQTAVVTVTTNGIPLASLPGLVLNGPEGFAATTDDFLVDTFSICSFSSMGDDYDSVLAHGTVANLVITVPPPAQNLAGTFTNGLWQVQFSNHLGWLYTLERTTNFNSWTEVAGPASGNGTNLVMSDNNSLPAGAFYRIRAERP